MEITGNLVVFPQQVIPFWLIKQLKTQLTVRKPVKCAGGARDDVTHTLTKTNYRLLHFLQLYYRHKTSRRLLQEQGGADLVNLYLHHCLHACGCVWRRVLNASEQEYKIFLGLLWSAGSQSETKGSINPIISHLSSLKCATAYHSFDVYLGTCVWKSRVCGWYLFLEATGSVRQQKSKLPTIITVR